MIKATSIHHSVLDTSDERTAGLAEIIHSMGDWLSEGLISDEAFVHIHNILRANLETENFLSVVKHKDTREENNEYHILVAEFPMKADGKVHKLKFNEEENAFYLLTEDDEFYLEQIVLLGEKEAETLRNLKETRDDDLALELSDFLGFYIENQYGQELLLNKNMTIYYEHEKLKDTKDAVLVEITNKKERN